VFPIDDDQVAVRPATTDDGLQQPALPLDLLEQLPALIAVQHVWIIAAAPQRLRVDHRVIVTHRLASHRHLHWKRYAASNRT
jgi:hypothetical protein